MTFPAFLKESAARHDSILCFGIDPDLEQMPLFGLETEERIVKFYCDIVDAALQQENCISAIKPNYAYFAQYGFEGLRALQRIIKRYRGKIPVIFDAKRGDIGKSSKAYAAECFVFWGADAITVSPYMGQDSIQPFLSFCKEGKGVYVLCRTSNPGAADFQSIWAYDGKPLFYHVASKIAKWFVPGVGVVAGATAIEELEKILWVFYDMKVEAPFLIPGVGAQGGSASQVAETLRAIWQQTFALHRINASSSIAQKWKEKQTEDYVGAALEEMKSLNSQIGKINL
ncbi:MAG: orotidine-5'-phosphate decarboxylase [Candidatus Anstonellaceae archaeon]